MQTQRDHVHAHDFQMGRMSAALVLGDPASAESPAQRALVGVMIGFILTVLVLAGLVIYGWLVPGGNTSWRVDGTVVVEKESGTRYAYLGGALHPTRNLASALLIQGSAANPKLVSRNSLKGVPHGALVGLPGAPQVLPASNGFLRGPWLACPAGAGRLGLNLDPSARAEPLAADRFVLARADGHMYLLWRDKKHLVTDDGALIALGAAGADPVPAPRSWLAHLPDGPSIGVPRIGGAGRPGPVIAGRARPIGALFSQEISIGARYYVLRPDGLAPVNDTALLLMGAGGGGPPVRLTAADVVGAPQSADRTLAGLLPGLNRATYQDLGGDVVCQRQQPRGDGTVTAALALTAREYAGLRADGTAGLLMRPGTGMVVTPIPSVNSQRPRPVLITEEGRRYLLAADDVLSAFAISGDSIVPFPADELAVVPAGPVLSRAVAASIAEG